MRERRSIPSRPATALFPAMLMLALLLVSFPAGPAVVVANGQVNQDENLMDMSGPAVISGAIGGSATVTPGLNAFAVTLNFGELSPINQALMVKATLPITIQATQHYQVRATVLASSGGSDANAVQLTDVGLGVMNLRFLVGGACAGVITPLFHNDPSLNMSINATTGRATYPSTLGDASPGTVLLRGRRVPGQTAAFDLILVCAPQFYSTGAVSITILITLEVGAAVSC